MAKTNVFQLLLQKYFKEPGTYSLEGIPLESVPTDMLGYFCLIREGQRYFKEGKDTGSSAVLLSIAIDQAIYALREYAEKGRVKWEDAPLPEDDAINEAFPTRSGRHDLYQEAMRLVGARHSKGALVSLVTWLLLEREAAKTKFEMAIAMAKEE